MPKPTKRKAKTSQSTTGVRKNKAALDARLVPLLSAFRSDPRVAQSGTGFGSGALKVGGKIFAMISARGSFVVKLPKERVTELVSAGRGQHFDPGRGRLMKEWFASDEKPSAWLALAKEAHAFVSANLR